MSRTAIVTGATRGIGRAIAERLVADGLTVVGTGTKPGGDVPEGCDYRAVDLGDPGAAEAFGAELAEIGPDVLVNNAGINIVSPFTEVATDDFEKVHRINLLAPMVLARSVVPGMKERGWGRIVNVGSIWGKISKEGRASYSAAKFGLDGLTAALSAEVAQYGVLANCVAPGFIDTEMTRTNLGEEGIRTLTAQVPVRRLGRPEEIAALVAWLAGPENTFVTGQNIAIDGGFTRV